MEGQLNLYDINKQIVSQLPFYTEENWEGANYIVDEWIKTKNDTFFMLYGREINYFTLFRGCECGEFNSIFSALRECLNCVGPIYSINVTEDETAVEIWANVDEQATCLYLFPYDDGVVSYGR